jgi:hypothetical protein
LLWPRGGISRNANLTTYNPFSKLPETEHDLVRLFLAGEPNRVSVQDTDWYDQACDSLVRDSEVILVAEPNDLRILREALLKVVTGSIDSGFVLLHPTVNRVDRRAGLIEIGLSLPEGVQ